MGGSLRYDVKFCSCGGATTPLAEAITIGRDRNSQGPECGHRPETIVRQTVDSERSSWRWGAVWVLAALVIGVSGQAIAPRALFVAVEPDGLRGEADQWVSLEVLRQRVVQVDHQLLENARLRAGGVDAGMRLNLFRDLVLNVEIDRSGPTSAGYWLSGRVVGGASSGAPALGSLVLVVNGEVVVGTVRTATGIYRVRSLRDGRTAVTQVDPSMLLRELSVARQSGSTGSTVRVQVPGRAMPIRAPQPQMFPERSAEVLGGAEDGARIDVLSVYTPTARELYGGHDAIRAELDLAVAEVNQAYANSGVIQRLNLVYATEVDYVPDDDGGVNLRRLQDPDDGYLDEVHAIRDQYAADIVTLEPGGTHIVGQAFVMRDPSTDFADRAFTSQGISGYGFAHEFGHLQGLSHDRYQVTQETSDDLSDHKPHPYSFGYVN